MKTGEIVKLGDHRLICGDAKDPEIVEKLVGEDQIRIVLTDPPYGVKYASKERVDFYRNVVKAPISKEKDIANDDLTGDNYTDFTKEWIEPVKNYLVKKNAFYIFNSDQMIFELKKAMDQSGIYYSQLIIWIKNTIFPGMKDYLTQHELIAYGWKGRHKFEKSKRKSVIFYPKPHRSKLHPTMKPVGLLRKLILNSTKVGEVIYDPFGGSGSTLIACEQTKRKCLMIELDEDYCEVIRKRYERYVNSLKK